MKKYSDTNEYILVDGNMATVGISKQKLEELGDVVHVDLPQKGKEIKKGEVLLSVEAIKTENDILSPVSGRIIDVNHEVENNPDIVNEDPEGKGWLCKIELCDPSEIELLKDEIS